MLGEQSRDHSLLWSSAGILRPRFAYNSLGTTIMWNEELWFNIIFKNAFWFIKPALLTKFLNYSSLHSFSHSLPKITVYSATTASQLIFFVNRFWNLNIWKQGQVGQQGATCGSSNECFTNRPTDQRTQPVTEMLCRTLKRSSVLKC